MNSKLHRVIFNKTRELFLVVADTMRTVAGGQARSNGTKRPRTAERLQPRAVALCVWTCMVSMATQAQIIADPTAPASQRPTVLMDAMGRPLVNIQTPGAGGVSRNTYRQFDVQSDGVTLNSGARARP